MNQLGDTDFQGSVDKLSDPKARTINDPKRSGYPSTPDLTDKYAPVPKTTTDYPVKSPRPSGAA